MAAYFPREWISFINQRNEEITTIDFLTNLAKTCGS